MSKNFEVAMVLATLTGFAGIICSLMFSLVYQIQGQKIDIAKFFIDLSIQQPDQFNQTDANKIINSYEGEQQYAAYFAIGLFIIGLILCLFSLFFAIKGFKEEKD